MEPKSRSALTVYTSRMNRNVKALEAFLKAVDCDLESKGCCKLFEDLRAAVHNFDETTFSAKHEELRLFGRLMLKQLEEEYQRKEDELAICADKLELARKCCKQYELKAYILLSW